MMGCDTFVCRSDTKGWAGSFGTGLALIVSIEGCSSGEDVGPLRAERLMRIFWRILAIALLMSAVGYGQSLGDVARENRERKAEDASAASPKVITNKDLPKDPAASQDAPQTPAVAPSAATEPNSDRTIEDKSLAARRAADNRGAHRSMQQRMAEQRAADQWKRQILAQKEKMAALQSRIDQIRGSIRAAYGNVQYQEPYNRPEARQLQRIEQIQQQLDEQQIRLNQMQEAARRAGMHSAVYDP